MHIFKSFPYCLNKSCRGFILLLSVFVLCSFVIMPSTAYSQHQDLSPGEYGLKAVYLYNFLQFVRFPAAKCLLDNERVEEIAVLGESPISESLIALQKELMKKTGANITLRFLGPYVKGMDLSACRLLFISPSEKKNIMDILDTIGDNPVLTIADSADCLDMGCMIVLVSRMNKVRWAVNRTPVEQSGLRLNSRLLSMAVRVIN